MDDLHRTNSNTTYALCTFGGEGHKDEAMRLSPVSTVALFDSTYARAMPPIIRHLRSTFLTFVLRFLCEKKHYFLDGTQKM
jgi:hypothetical protein